MKKAHSQSGVKPSTSWSRGKCSTAALQPRLLDPPKLGNLFLFYGGPLFYERLLEWGRINKVGFELVSSDSIVNNATNTREAVLQWICNILLTGQPYHLQQQCWFTKKILKCLIMGSTADLFETLVKRFFGLRKKFKCKNL